MQYIYISNLEHYIISDICKITYKRKLFLKYVFKYLIDSIFKLFCINNLYWTKNTVFGMNIIKMLW